MSSWIKSGLCQYLSTKQGHAKKTHPIRLGAESMSDSNELNGGQVIIDYLIKEKVPYVFGLCGHGNIGLIDAMHERQEILQQSQFIMRVLLVLWLMFIIGYPASPQQPLHHVALVQQTCPSALVMLFLTQFHF